MARRAVKTACLATVLIGTCVGAWAGAFGELSVQPASTPPSSTSSATTSDAPQVRASAEASVPAVRRACVPVLMYHHIADPGNAIEMVKLWFVTPERFAEQMEWLHQAGFHTISPQQLREHLEKGTDLPSRPIVITFDDGWGDQYANAYPVLKRLGMSGVFYVYSGGINAPGYMSWDQLREMQVAGMVIGSHTISHPDLTGLDDAAVMKELTESKAAIAKNLERPCDDFAYPYGQFDDRIMKLTKAAGYTTSMGTEPGFTQRQDELLELRRMRVSWHESIVTFKALIPSPEEQTRRP